MKNVFDLSNDDLVRQNSIHHEKIKWENHVEWFKNRITKTNEPFYIVEDDNKNFIGQVRIDKKFGENVISISITKKYRGLGLASEIIKEAVEKSKLQSATAYVYKNNVSSIKSFEKAGFIDSNLIKLNYLKKE